MLNPKLRWRDKSLPVLQTIEHDFATEGQLYDLGVLAPPERRALYDIVQSLDLMEVDGEVFGVCHLKPETIDTLATVGTSHEDMEDDTVDEEHDGTEVDDEEEEEDLPEIRERFAADRMIRPTQEELRRSFFRYTKSPLR